MQRLGLIDHGLQRDRVRHEFIVDDGFLLIGGVVGSKQSIPTERQGFGKLMVPLDLGRALMHGAPQGVTHYPFQQVRSAHRFPKFLQGKRETIARAVAVDASEDGRWREGAALDGQCEVHKLRVVFTDQRQLTVPLNIESMCRYFESRSARYSRSFRQRRIRGINSIPSKYARPNTAAD